MIAGPGDWAQVSDMQRARLGWVSAQEELAGAPRGDGTRMECGWHGTAFDRERGAFGVVHTRWAEVVGERLLVLREGPGVQPSCIVYVHSYSDRVVGDLSLARRAFAALDVLSADGMSVVVRVVDKVLVAE